MDPRAGTNPATEKKPPHTIFWAQDVKSRQCKRQLLQRSGEPIPIPSGGYVAECLEIAVVTQGRTLDETVKHLQEATALHLEGEHLADFGLREKPTLVLTMELDPAHAQAS